MPKRGSAALEGELLQGTLDLLILKTLILGVGFRNLGTLS